MATIARRTNRALGWFFVSENCAGECAVCLGGILASIYNRIDAVLLEQWLPEPRGAQQAGLYAAAYRLLDAANMLPVLVATVLIPLYARRLHEGQEVNTIAGMGIRLLAAAALLFVVPSLWFATELMHLLYHSVPPELVSTFLFLLPSFLFTVSIYVYSSLLTADGRLRLHAQVALVGVLVNVGLNAWLIPRQAAVGAAQAAFITQAVMAVLYFWACLRQRYVRVHSPSVLRFLGFAFVLIGWTFACKNYLPLRWEVAWLLAMAGGAVVAFVLNVWPVEGFRQDKKSPPQSITP